MDFRSPNGLRTHALGLMQEIVHQTLYLTGESSEALSALVLVSEEEGETGLGDRELKTQELVERTHVQIDQLGERERLLQGQPLVRLGAGWKHQSGLLVKVTGNLL